MFRSIQITARRSFLVNRSQYQKFPPISDDHSLKHVPKINFGSAKEAKKSFIRKTLGVVKILLGGVVGTFLLGATYVVVSEYLEDFKGLSEEEDLNMESKGFTSKLAEADAIGLLKNLEKGKYEILVVSPSNYFLFTPLLPSVTVGTLEPRSLLEPVRRILRRFSAGSAFFFQASAVDVDINAKKVLVKGPTAPFSMYLTTTWWLPLGPDPTLWA
ncbi:hypothetical protein L0F63_003743 [Massospora cicadina]|nr:hypothetical protein L0F63_003743 [Massospora cicadina]